MMKYAFSALVAIGLAGTAAAQSATTQRSIDNFRHLDAGGNFDIRFEPSDVASLRFEGDVDDIDDIEIDLRGDTLEIRQDRGALGWFGRRRHLNLTVYVSGPGVSSFEFSRGIDANISALEGDDIAIRVSTGADAEFSGTCGTARINVSTGSDLDGRDLACGTIRANASTGATVTIDARDELVANASTGADIRSITRPQSLSVRSSTGGNVRAGSRRSN
ncbi:GIN domain-containing protein [Hyphobacterium sp.]|uniref:GIN domain-containing protein n=1 Tax=Hyphobacterium sp. TaxID=2004662 RepID=UPI0037498B2E